MRVANSVLGNLKSRLVLATYAEPLTPSEVAHRLRLPANTVHYWTRKLVGAGFLEQVEIRGRSRVYRMVEDAGDLEPESVRSFAENLLGGLSKSVIGAVERWELSGSSAPHIDVHELQLRASDVPKVVEAVRSLIETWDELSPEHNGEEMYSLTFVATPGRLSEES